MDVAVDWGSDHLEVVQSNAVKLIVAESRPSFFLATKKDSLFFFSIYCWISPSRVTWSELDENKNMYNTLRCNYEYNQRDATI